MDTQQSCVFSCLTVLYSLFIFISPFTCGFNLDTEHPKIFSSPQTGTAFGHRVCPFGSKPGDSVLVTDPLYGNGTGEVYRCYYGNGRCEPVHVEVESGSVFGFSLACSDHRAVVCGPRLLQKCEGFNYLNGFCTEFRPDMSINHSYKPAFKDCHVILPLDAVILFDDSNSITTEDFIRMINFIKSLIRAFVKDPKAQVGVAKFSTGASAIFQFENYALSRDAEQLMSDVTHSRGQTHTPSAIRFVLEKMFVEEVGMRNKSQKLLVVITDGKSNENEPLDDVINQAQKRGITRFAIGVGREYSPAELKLIASSPEFVFETESFSALTTILNLLTNKIFSIEGTNVGNSSSIQLELSQGGFSVALSQEVSVYGAVGVYSWEGGLEEKRPQLNSSFINNTNLHEDMKDSYLGYSVAVATVEGSVVYFAGAPRHKHTGLVLGFTRNQGNQSWTVTHRVNGSQLGSYFGAELCVLDGLLAVGAPLYHSNVAGGEVTLYTLTAQSLISAGVLRGKVGVTFAGFGWALAALQDLNGDSLRELGVGAPHEEGCNGAVYIFLSRPGGIRTKHSQRVCGSSLGAGLQYFGLSLDSAVDLSSDGLPDIVVGSRGSVSVLRTNPVMCVNVSITLDPPIIPQNSFHCSAPYGINTPVAKATVCVNLKEVSMGTVTGPLSAGVSVHLELDSGLKPRLLFYPKNTSSVWNTSITSTNTICTTSSITLQRCISDYGEVPLSVKLLVEGETVEGTAGLTPVQNPDCTHTFTHLVTLEKVCGEDHVCVSDLNISVRINRNMVVNVEGFTVNVSVVLVNNGEDATEPELHFHHPSILSFTRVTPLEFSGHVWCVSNDTTNQNITHTFCRLSITVFRQKAQVKLNMSFQVSDSSSLSDQLTINTSIISKNENPETLHDNNITVTVPVKQLVNFLLENGGSTQFITYDQVTLINHTYQVRNMGELSIPVSVMFVLPLEMSSGFLWDVSPPAVSGSGVQCEQMKYMESLHSQYCKNTSCRLIGCSIQMLTPDKPISFQFSGHVKNDKKVSGVQVTVVSCGQVLFNEDLYVQYLNEEDLKLSIVTEVESPSQAQTVLIASLSVFFGLIMMIILFYVLYKVGFLKSKSLGAAQVGSEGDVVVAHSGGEGEETPADCQTTETVADEETPENNNTAHMTVNTSVL